MDPQKYSLSLSAVNPLSIFAVRNNNLNSLWHKTRRQFNALSTVPGSFGTAAVGPHSNCYLTALSYNDFGVVYEK